MAVVLVLIPLIVKLVILPSFMPNLTVNVITVLVSIIAQSTKLVVFVVRYTLTVLSVVELFILLLAFHVRQAATLITQVVVSSAQVTLQPVSQQKTLLLVSLHTL